jgi:hypothetical protein
MPSHDGKTMKRYKGTLLLYYLVANWGGFAQPRTAAAIQKASLLYTQFES